MRTNSAVADEIGTLVARHRYAAEDGKDAVRAAESSSARRNEEIKDEATQRRQQIAERAEQAKEAAKPKDEWASRRDNAPKELQLGLEDDFDEVEETPAQQPTAAPSAKPAAPTSQPAPVRRRGRPSFDDDDDDFENQSWLR